MPWKLKKMASAQCSCSVVPLSLDDRSTRCSFVILQPDKKHCGWFSFPFDDRWTPCCRWYTPGHLFWRSQEAEAMSLATQLLRTLRKYVMPMVRRDRVVLVVPVLLDLWKGLVTFLPFFQKGFLPEGNNKRPDDSSDEVWWVVVFEICVLFGLAVQCPVCGRQNLELQQKCAIKHFYLFWSPHVFSYRLRVTNVSALC